MARKKIESVVSTKAEMQEELLSLIPEYGKNKQTLDECDKLCKSANNRIKEIMNSLDMDSLTVEGWKVTYSVSNRTSLNEDKLLEYIKKNPEIASVVVKTREYVDMDELEKLMYAGNIDDDLIADMKDCEETKKVETLRISKAKEKNNAN